MVIYLFVLSILSSNGISVLKFSLLTQEMQHLSEPSVLILTDLRDLAGIKAKTTLWYLAYAISEAFTLSQFMADRLSCQA